MRKIRVLQVNKLYYPVTGGIEKVVQDISEGLLADPAIENQVLVCQPKGRGIKEKVNGVPITRCGSLGTVCSLPISLSFLWEFKRLSKRMDIIHIHVPFPLGDLACLLSGYEGKVVVWWHSDVVRQKRLMRLYHPIMVRLLNRADAIIVATKGHIDGSKYLKPYRRKCHVIPFGVDRDLMTDADSYLKQEKEPRDTVEFLFAGRLVYYKGCDTMLRAFASIRHQEAHLTIIGDGALRGELECLAAQLGVRDRVDFLGEVERSVLLERFAGCDVFLLPSVAPSEAFGIVQIEAMAYGKPVINTDLKSGVPYVSIHGETGLTVKAGDARQLADAMERLATQPGLRRQYGDAAARRARDCYHMDSMIQKVKALYERLVV